MGTLSDRAYFLEAIKNNPMTVSDIIEQFKCAPNTARNWVKHDEVEQVLGSYPPAYVRKDTLIVSQANKPSGRKADKLTIDLDLPPQEEIEIFFRKIMSGEAGNIDFQTEFRSVDSQKSLMLLSNKLKSALIVTDYYRSLMIKDGIE